MIRLALQRRAMESLAGQGGWAGRMRWAANGEPARNGPDRSVYPQICRFTPAVPSLVLTAAFVVVVAWPTAAGAEVTAAEPRAVSGDLIRVLLDQRVPRVRIVGSDPDGVPLVCGSSSEDAAEPALFAPGPNGL